MFRGERGGLLHTMAREFPLLLSRDNRENMRIAVMDGMICSVVNFLPRRIAIEGTPVAAASIGAVCTHPDHRGRGYSSEILNHVEEGMKDMGVRICLISGTRNLYTRWGAGRVKNSVRYRIPSGSEKLPWTIREYSKTDLPALKEIYALQKTRYIREGSDFDILIESGTHPFGDTTYYRYVMEDEKGIAGYIILRRTPEGIQVKEAAGERKKIFMSLAWVGGLLDTDEIHYILPQGEDAPPGCQGVEEYLQGTLKIIDAEGLTEDLRPYFRQRAGMAGDYFRISGSQNGYQLTLKRESIDLYSHDELLKILFQGDRDNKYRGGIGEFIRAVFPLPLPWTENLNYQ